jgi:hypothetical protein
MSTTLLKLASKDALEYFANLWGKIKGGGDTVHSCRCHTTLSMQIILIRNDMHIIIEK